MHYFFAHEIKDNTAYIHDKEILTRIRALRIESHEKILINYEKKIYEAYLVEYTKSKAFFELIKEIPPVKQQLDLTFIQALPKKKKFEFIIEKAIESGFSKIIPVNSKFTVQKYMEHKVERYNRIALQAAMQCESRILPEVFELIDIEKIKPESKLNIVLYEKAENSLKNILRSNPACESITIVAGAEGGFSSEEITQLEEKGFLVAGIPGNILRCETVCIAAGAILKYEYQS